jgi:galactokinase
VTADALAARLGDRGMSPGDVGLARLLLDRLLQAFGPFAGAEPEHAWWVPGRIEVFGKHTDYCGGHSLVGALPRGLAFAARGRADATIRLLDVSRSESVTLAAGGVPSDSSGWRHYANVVVQRLSRNFPGAALGADVVFASNLPSASGMSSSSALMIGLAETLAHLAGLRDRVEWQGNVSGPLDAAGYYACIENGMTFGSLRGDSGVGTHGGSEDHVAILAGAPGQLSANSFVPIRHVGDVMVPDDWTFVVASSGVAAKKTGGAKEAYNRLSHEAAALLNLWNRHEPQQPSLRAAMSSHPSAPERLRQLVRLADSRAQQLERRLTHFLNEDARVLEGLEAIRGRQASRVSTLSDASQREAETLLSNQVPETIALARAARDHGAFAGSSFGAGFGGSVWALVEHEEATAFAGRWLAAYRSRFPSRTAMAFAARPGPPITLLTVA